MRKMILAATMAAFALPPASARRAQRGNEPRRSPRMPARASRLRTPAANIAGERRECAREISQARNRDCRTYNRYDYNRSPGVDAYYADDYYRDGRYYGESRLSSQRPHLSRPDGRYYCRRNDGTTGLIIGGGVGALIGNSLDDGRSSMLGTIIGAGAGGAIGREVDRGIAAAATCAAAKRTLA